MLLVVFMILLVQKEERGGRLGCILLYNKNPLHTNMKKADMVNNSVKAHVYLKEGFYLESTKGNLAT